MKCKLLIYLLFFNGLLGWSMQEKESELLINNYLDSIFISNNLDYKKIQDEYLFYFKRNYKSFKSIEGSVHYFSQEKKEKMKSFTSKYLNELNLLKDLSVTTHSAFMDFEKKVLSILNEEDLWGKDVFLTRLYVVLHEINYWDLNCFKPTYISNKIVPLYHASNDTALTNKIAVFVLIEKIYKRNQYINRALICQSKNYKINIEMDVEYETSLNNEESFDIVHPIFPGGKELKLKFISDNLEYPVKAIDHNIKGTVLASFFVSESGDITNVKICKSPSDILSKETIRLIRSMPKWKPGTINNESAKIKHTIPIHFELDN